ncbi:alpha/beta fold hydrolase [Modestobacter sp. URMC 112]
MSPLTTQHTTAGSLAVPGARLHYEVCGDGPPVLLIGSPMDARPFAPLADVLAADHTVLTTDPRGINRSTLDDPDEPTTVQARADDLARLLTHLGAGPAAVFGSSGGAVSALALARSRPELVHTVVAHEPPLLTLLPDAEQRRAGTEAVVATYLAEGSGPAWVRFLAEAGLALPDGEGPAGPVPAERDPRDVEDERRFFLHDLRATTGWRPDVAALRAGPTRIVVGIGEQSTGQLCDLTSRALAAALGVEPAFFPGDHAGFAADPAGAAARLRAVLGEV